MRPVVRALLLVALVAAAACDRRIEPFVPGEEPREPDLSRIFPAGAEEAEGQPQLPAPPARGAPPVAAAEVGPPIEGTVRVAPELEGRVPSGGVLFLIARRDGGGPPLAVKRIASPRFPLPFEIGPGDRMIAAIPFAGPVTLSARVDADGNATTRTPGDLQGAAAGAVMPGATGVELVLDEVIGDGS